MHVFDMILHKVYFKGYKRVIIFLVILFFTFIYFDSNAMAAGFILGGDDEMVIVIDPGHGGEQEGAQFEYDGVMIDEKDLDLSIAINLRNELLGYEHVRVVMTRESDITLGLKERADIAMREGADYFISVHCNAEGEDEESLKNPTGAMIIVPYGKYQPAMSVSPNVNLASELLGKSVLDNLCEYGLGIARDFGTMNNNGIVKRPYSKEGWAKATKYYPDNSVTDYYGQMRFNMEYGIPAILIEHAYMSNEGEYRKYLESEESRKALAVVDAKGIANALKLVPTSENTEND